VGSLLKIILGSRNTASKFPMSRTCVARSNGPILPILFIFEKHQGVEVVTVVMEAMITFPGNRCILETVHGYTTPINVPGLQPFPENE